DYYCQSFDGPNNVLF
nr:immunoglobulin light chain junction region [Macaca mulatta]MOY16071.1 immunoglobulin light chain junction region [Macaca mulatta]